MQFKSEYSDMRGSKGEKSKARLILNFLKNNQDRAFYSTEIYNALKDKQDDKKRYRAFVTFYNHEREHGGIGGTTPAEKFEKRLKRPGLQAKARQKVLPMLGTRSVTHVW
jgi:transposase InsO family protein